MTHLPEQFLNRMHTLLGAEYDAFLASYDRPRVSGLRVNTMKCTPKRFTQLMRENPPYADFCPVPWTPNGFFIPEGVRMGTSPLYAAGVFYLQEPSAMTPASRLPVSPGERVLDLCAAPGGKATELAARLNGQGLLVANDISASRAKALLRNLELFGVSNLFVTNETPGNLANAFEGFFDKILVDAPCSGEGMFRKDASVIAAWTPDKPAHCAKLQRDILENAVKMLREGGYLLYSTCTFAPEEDEGMVSWLLEQFPEMQLVEIEGCEGFAPGRPAWGNGNPELTKCVRIWPHRMDGEGHFLALLVKNPGSESEPSRSKQKKKGKPTHNRAASAIPRQDRAILEDFLQKTNTPFPADALQLHGERVFFSPSLPAGVHRLRFLRNGLYLGDLKKNRFEPSQPFAMTQSADTFSDCLNLRMDDGRIASYLAGESIPVFSDETSSGNGWKLVCVEGFSLGWGKLVNGILKNKYPAGWRR